MTPDQIALAQLAIAILSLVGTVITVRLIIAKQGKDIEFLQKGQKDHEERIKVIERNLADEIMKLVAPIVKVQDEIKETQKRIDSEILEIYKSRSDILHRNQNNGSQ